MANPQAEDGHTKIANELMDALCKIRIPGEERQVLDCIFRKTYGWNKTEDAIALSQFVEMTGINKPCIIRAIHGLLSKKIIIVIEKDNAPAKVYKINKDFETWQPLSKKIMLSKKIISVIKKDNPSLSKKIPTKATTTKDTITKDNYIRPEWISRESWEAFIEMRVRKKAPLTVKAADLIVKKLKKMRDGTGQDPNETLDESTMNEWKGVFKLKNGGNGNGNGNRFTGSAGKTFEKAGGARSDDQPYPVDVVCTE
jgi:phage replication O-like protein O